MHKFIYPRSLTRKYHGMHILSSAATIPNKATPKTDTRMRLAKIGGESMVYCEAIIIKPRPLSEAMNSPTIAPTTHIVELIFNPAKYREENWVCGASKKFEALFH